MTKPHVFLLLLLGILTVSCAGSLGNLGADDPTERGLSYVAAAIVTNAVLRGIFNK